MHEQFTRAFQLPYTQKTALVAIEDTEIQSRYTAVCEKLDVLVVQNDALQNEFIALQKQLDDLIVEAVNAGKAAVVLAPTGPKLVTPGSLDGMPRAN